MEIQNNYTQEKRDVPKRIQEPVMVFKNGLVYRAHTRDPQPENSLRGECEFHAVVFYKKFDGHKVVASYREHTHEPIIHRIFPKDTKKKVLQSTCLEILTETLRNDCAKDWYSHKDFVLGEKKKGTVENYFSKTNEDTYIGKKDLNIKNLVEFKDE